MALLLRQIWTLTIKNLRITLFRHWLSTPLRALLFPILIVLFLSFTQNFLSTDSQYGLGDARPIRPLSQIRSSLSGGRDRVVFVNNGHSNGDIDRVIGEVASPLRDSGINTLTVAREQDLRIECTSGIRGSSKCIAAVVFHSSRNEGTGGSWNYTIQADGVFGTTVYVHADNNDAQVYIMPLQRAIDSAVARMTPGAKADALAQPVFEYPFTSETDEERAADVRGRFMTMVSNILATPFYLALACLIYQMTGFMATEREIGMTKLLDTMMPNRARWQPQAARIFSHHLAFDLLYGPGWVATGAILGARCFPRTSVIIPLLFHVLAGLSTTSLAIFSASFFDRAQLSGIVSIMASLLLGIIAQLTAKAGTGVIVVLSLLFPPMNYVYFLVQLSRWERQDRPLNLLKSAPKSSSTFSLPAIVFWIFAIIHTIIYPILGAFIERKLWGTGSSARKTVVSQSPIAVDLQGFTKQYAPGFMAKMLSFLTKQPTEPVLAVDNLTLQANRGEIMVLLGANGSGKSTTLDAIAGLHAISSGQISINYQSPQEGFGYCPQKNILWDDLTVREHVKIFDGIKSIGKRATRAEMESLIESCDLTKKKKGLSKSLSGGQKRKLQMAMMFAGGSTVCCVDEVSSGVDPLSRRKLWDILLAERGRRSIILTTHFLDEADLLADRISILSKGSLRASGTSVELKQRLGSGYRVHLHHVPGATRPPLYNNVLHTDHSHETIYFPGSSTETHRFLKQLDNDGVDNYDVNGPTLEDVFFKVEEQANADGQRASFESVDPSVNSGKPDMLPELRKGKPIGMAKQILVLISKRFTVFRRSPGPHLAALVIPIVAAGCSTLFLKSVPFANCNPAEALDASGGVGPATADFKLVVGPNAKLSGPAIDIINRAPAGAVTRVETLDQFNRAVQGQFTELVPGGFFIGDNQSTMAWRADGPPVFALLTQNIVNSLVSNMTINTSFDVLDVPFASNLSGLLLFIILGGLSMAIYPAFLALYPTMERLQGIRAMHYSNGVRALPLWLGYLIFDFLFVLLISVVCVTIFGATVDVWYAMEYIFLIFLLYGVAATLYAYVISLFSKSQLAALAITAATQAVFFLIYFILFMVVFTKMEGTNQSSVLNIAYFTLALVSPIVSLSKSLYLIVNVFGVSCRNKKLASYPGDINLYGGPILYLILQSLVLFAILFWKESGSSLRLWPKKSKVAKGGDEIELEAPPEFAGTTRSSDGLRVMRLRKQFKKHVAVDDVTFGVPRSECFALVGPNGAGKSTTMNMIRGDLKPSGSDSEIFIDGISAMQERGKARARLGVCPQIDPLDSMTVAEHLKFYARIRGIPNPTHNIQAIIRAVGLERFTNRIATALSGGNKRKLALGIALVGNPTVLLLDEPSSGMDAVSKRIMWRTLTSITPGRSLLLTTHSMEEADALASRAGIVAGRMLAAGTTEELRALYGNAYYVHLVHRHAPHTSAAEMDRIKRWVQREFPEAVVEGWMCYGQIKFEIPLAGAGGSSSLADIFGKLEKGKASLNIQDYSVSTATLDQIFLSVVGKHFVREEGE